MIVCSSCLGRMLFFCVKVWIFVTFLGLGLSGLVLLRLLLQMLVVFLVVLPLVMVWSLGVVWLVSGVFGLEVVRFAKFIVMLLMFMMLLVSSCIVTLLLPPLLDMGRRFKAIMDVLDAMVRYGVSLARSVELTVQRDKILAAGLLHPVTLDYLCAVQGLGIRVFHRVVSDLHRRLGDFIHSVVVYRRDEAVRRESGIGFGRTPWCIPTGGFVQIWLPQLHFSSVSLILRLVVLGCSF